MDIMSDKDSKEIRLSNPLLKKDGKFLGKNIDPFIYLGVTLLEFEPFFLTYLHVILV
jgi:hypothetical protein